MVCGDHLTGLSNVDYYKSNGNNGFFFLLIDFSNVGIKYAIIFVFFAIHFPRYYFEL